MTTRDASLDEPVHELIAPADFRGLRLDQIMAALVVEYGVATPTDITDMRSALQIPFVAGTSLFRRERGVTDLMQSILDGNLHLATSILDVQPSCVNAVDQVSSPF